MRLGDPETQVVLPLLETDLFEIFQAVIDERLDEVKLEWSSQCAACVVMAAPGYPGDYPKGLPLSVSPRYLRTSPYFTREPLCGMGI